MKFFRLITNKTNRLVNEDNVDGAYELDEATNLYNNSNDFYDENVNSNKILDVSFFFDKNLSFQVLFFLK